MIEIFETCQTKSIAKQTNRDESLIIRSIYPNVKSPSSPPSSYSKSNIIQSANGHITFFAKDGGGFIRTF